MRNPVVVRMLVLCALGIMGTAQAKAAAATAPVVSLSLRGVGDGTIEPGEPLSVAVRLAVPARSNATIALAPPSGTWVGAVAVEIINATGSPVLARAEPVGQPESAHITLDAKRAAGGLWMFPGTATRLAPGDYHVRVTLSIDAGGGWLGRARSAAWPLKIVAVSDAPERISQRTLARAAEAAAKKDLQAAAAILDAQLKLTPTDRPLLLLRAAIAEQAGNVAAALFCVNLAARGLPADSPSPAGLSEMQVRLRAKLLQPPDSEAARVPPLWTWPPASPGP